jgi:hypothetical protein
MRVDSSPPVPPILGLGTESGGGHAVAAGVQKGAHPDAANRDPASHPAFKLPSAGPDGGGRWALVGPLASDMSEAATPALSGPPLSSPGLN